MKVFNGIEELIGNTPLVEIKNVEKEENLYGKVYVKLEYLNPAGSIKDRAAFYMLKDAEEKGLIRFGSTVIEPTSGNTGIGLAALCASKGYSLILTMPETMSIERRKLLAIFGAEIVLTPGSEGMGGAIAKANEIIIDQRLALKLFDLNKSFNLSFIFITSSLLH